MSEQIPLLLRTQQRTSEAPAVSMDFQACVGLPLAAVGPTECVVVLTRAVDKEVDDLSLRLAARGIALLRIDADRCEFTDIVWDLASGTLNWNGMELRPILCWHRLFDLASMNNDAIVGPYVRDQWSSFALALAGSDRVRTINSPHSPDRLAQLAGAQQVGFRIPRTVIAANLRQAAERFGGPGDLLVKVLGKHAVEPERGLVRGVFPQRLAVDQVVDTTEAAPVIVQEYLPAKRELRVYLVGGQLISYAVGRPDPNAVWLAPETVSIERCAISADVAAKLLRLAQLWNLDVAAFDLLDCDDEPVFLEVNTDCSWLWTDSAAGRTETANAVAAHIESLFNYISRQRISS